MHGAQVARPAFGGGLNGEAGARDARRALGAGPPDSPGRLRRARSASATTSPYISTLSLTFKRYSSVRRTDFPLQLLTLDMKTFEVHTTEYDMDITLWLLGLFFVTFYLFNDK